MQIWNHSRYPFGGNVALAPRLVLWKREVIIIICNDIVKSERIFSFFESSWNNICHLILLPLYMKLCNTRCFAWMDANTEYTEQSACWYWRWWSHFLSDTADVLSQKVPICSGSKGRCVLSSASLFRRRPASSRSVMVICPFGFVSLMRASWISCVHYICHRNGVSISIPLNSDYSYP